MAHSNAVQSLKYNCKHSQKMNRKEISKTILYYPIDVYNMCLYIYIYNI